MSSIIAVRVADVKFGIAGFALAVFVLLGAGPAAAESAAETQEGCAYSPSLSCSWH